MFIPSLRSSVPLLRRTALAPSPHALALAHRCLSTETRAALQKAVKASPVVLFMKGTPQLPECGFSRAVCQVLDLHGVPQEKMKAYNVLMDPELRTGIKEFSEWPTIPQIYVNGEFVGGCDIILGMHQSGELETLLMDHDIIPKELPETETAQPSTA